MSCHDRKFAGQLAADGELDVLMIRYNAAHRGAEQDIFPLLKEHTPGLVSYTATRWKYLIRRQSQWPKDRQIPTATQCYRFVLSNPHVDVCMMAPSNMKHFDENMAALDQGPLSEDEMKLIKEYGDLIHGQKHWFM
jgi:aryl-alcohol dehydrogenase-like predicted oxidoreductase